MAKIFKKLGFLLVGTALLPMDSSWSVDVDEPFRDAAFQTWESQSLTRQMEYSRFQHFLADNKVYGVIPTYELLRTASAAPECHESAFEIPPEKYWPNILSTLSYIKIYVIPKIGPVEAVSGYRNPVLNKCAQGAKGSAHAQYYALDLIPLLRTERKTLMHEMCAVHNQYGPSYNIGLGFYSGIRFHIDSRSFRRWGADTRSVTSPCAAFESAGIIKPSTQPE